MQVVIAGGGMAGLTVAALLSRTGSHRVTVLERSPEYATAGYGIGLYPLGAAVFHALGRYDELQACSSVLSRYEVHGPKGDPLQSVDLGALLAPFGPMFGVSRSDLISLLAGAVDEDVIRFGTEACAVDASAERLAVVTTGGERFEADVVVAADGMHSALRASLFGEVGGDDTGFDAWMWWAPAGSTPGDTASEYWGPSGFVGLYPIRDRVNVAVAVPRSSSPDPHAGTPQIVDALRASVAAHVPGAAALPGLFDLEAGAPFRWPMSDVRAPAITACGDRLALVGDAGIGFLPTAGVGASNALRAAAALAYELSLADAQTAPVALRRWEARIKPVVTANQHDSRELARVMMVKHASTSAVVNAVMKHLPVTSITKGIVKSMQAPF